MKVFSPRIETTSNYHKILFESVGDAMKIHDVIADCMPMIEAIINEKLKKNEKRRIR